MECLGNKKEEEGPRNLLVFSLSKCTQVWISKESCFAFFLKDVLLAFEPSFCVYICRSFFGTRIILNTLLLKQFWFTESYKDNTRNFIYTSNSCNVHLLSNHTLCVRHEKQTLITKLLTKEQTLFLFYQIFQ